MVSVFTIKTVKTEVYTKTVLMVTLSCSSPWQQYTTWYGKAQQSGCENGS